MSVPHCTALHTTHPRTDTHARARTHASGKPAPAPAPTPTPTRPPTQMEVQERGPNFYQLLRVTRASNPLEIKRAYKRMSLELHPDKNPSPNAIEEFDRLKDGYDTLMSQEQREIYNKFGEDGIKSNRIMNEYDILMEIFVYYLTWGMLAYILTLGKSSSNSRNWIYTGQIVMLVAEVLQYQFFLHSFYETHRKVK